MSELKHLPVAQLKEQYGLRSFVETGTEHGNGLRFAMTLEFQHYFSCDVNEEYARKASLEFGNTARIYNCNSLAFIRCLPIDIGPCLWWLDAHFANVRPGAFGEPDELRFPVMHELHLIRRRPQYNHDVIIIDDLICIEGSPRWHKGELCEELQVRSFTYDQLVQSMADTHEARFLADTEGILIFAPRANGDE
jgi:hypothetical protein